MARRTIRLTVLLGVYAIQHLFLMWRIAELEAFALGLQKEFLAFQAACSLPYNNGMTEGFVNKLKHNKGSMYERGSFELLRKRVLHPAA